MLNLFISAILALPGFRADVSNWGKGTVVLYTVYGGLSDTGEMIQSVSRIEDVYAFMRRIKQAPQNSSITDSIYMELDEKGNPLWFYEKTVMTFGKNPPITGETMVQYRDTLISILRRTSSGEMDTATVRAKEVAYPSAFVPFLLESADLKQGDSLKFRVLYPMNKRLGDATVISQGVGTLSTSLGKKKAVRYLLKLDRRSFNIWYDVRPPHRMLKYMDLGTEMRYHIKKVLKP